MTVSTKKTVAVAHCSASLYGADRQIRLSVQSLLSTGWLVEVYLPEDGPLIAELRELGASVTVFPFPVLRKSDLSLGGLTGLLRCLPKSMFEMVRVLRRNTPNVLYVNTITLPWWLTVGYLMKIPLLCHVHEAEEGRRVLSMALLAPLHLCSAVIANSLASERIIARYAPALRRRVTVIWNGVPRFPDGVRRVRMASVEMRPIRLLLVARVSPRKGTDVALDALRILRTGGLDVVLHICGSSYVAYEDFEAKLRHQSQEGELRNSVVWHGFLDNPYLSLPDVYAALVPSRAEPFGNAAVEAQLAGLPVIASNVQGLREIVVGGLTGVLIEPGNPESLADAVQELVSSPDIAIALAERGRESAERLFSVKSYGEQISTAIGNLVGSLT